MKFHPVSGIFPMMSADEFDALVKDIKDNGQLAPIYTYQEQIIDGRNRYRACELLGIQPMMREWDGNGSLVSFVVSLNLTRRHLESGQKAAIALEILPMLEAEARERQGKRNDLTSVKNLTEVIGPQRATEQAAQIVGTNRQYVHDAKKVRDESPVLFDRVKRGEISLVAAKREMKEAERQDRRNSNIALVNHTPPITAIAGDVCYQTIVIDPPWDWGDEGDADQFGRARPEYATMSIGEIAALPVGRLAERNAHIYLWITNRSLPKGFDLLERWGFRYVTCLTWCKPSIGMGNYFRGSTEQILFGVRGSLSLLRRDVGTWFEAARTGRHSGKPDEFYQLVESCSPGPWLEMFSRQPRNGWASWGAEA